MFLSFLLFLSFGQKQALPLNLSSKSYTLSTHIQNLSILPINAMRLLLVALLIIGSEALRCATTFARRDLLTSLHSSAATPQSLVQREVSGRARLAASALVVPSLLLLLKPTQANAAAAAATEEGFVSALSTVLTCKAILAPVEGYVKAAAYDNARSNVKYLLNQLQVEKATNSLLKGALDFSENTDALDDAADASANIGNYLIQLDSTIYTVIFIPSDDSGAVPPAAEKYLKMLYGYLQNVNKAFDLLLTLGSTEQLAAAKKLSEKQVAGLPDRAVLFKTVVKKSSI